MIDGKKIVVILPAYNAAGTLAKTVRDIPVPFVDEIILCDDASTDDTVAIARSMGLRVLVHEQNRGYGANQKSCYSEALKTGAEIIAMIHPDYQYDPRVLPAAVHFVALDICDIVIGSRIRTRRETLAGGMPPYKYLSNRFLTAAENMAFGQNLGDFHSGFRVYRREVLETIRFQTNSDDFIFDTQLLAQAIYRGYKIGDIPVPTRYSAESSSINFRRSVKYGFGCLSVAGQFLLQKYGLMRFRLFAVPAAAQRETSTNL
jgi:glycosyltransferase involved in cell wall biosynthesis